MASEEAESERLESENEMLKTMVETLKHEIDILKMLLTEVLTKRETESEVERPEDTLLEILKRRGLSQKAHLIPHIAPEYPRDPLQYPKEEPPDFVGR